MLALAKTYRAKAALLDSRLKPLPHQRESVGAAFVRAAFVEAAFVGAAFVGAAFVGAAFVGAASAAMLFVDKKVATRNIAAEAPTKAAVSNVAISGDFQCRHPGGRRDPATLLRTIESLMTREALGPGVRRDDDRAGGYC